MHQRSDQILILFERERSLEVLLPKLCTIIIVLLYYQAGQLKQTIQLAKPFWKYFPIGGFDLSNGTENITFPPNLLMKIFSVLL